MSLSSTPAPSRRTLARAGVWGVPTAVAASATPAFASSAPLPWLMVSFLDVPERFRTAHGLEFKCLVANTSSTPVPGPIMLTMKIPAGQELGTFTSSSYDWALEQSSDEGSEHSPTELTARTTAGLAPNSSVTFEVAFYRAYGSPFALEATVVAGDPRANHTNSFETWGVSPE